MFGWRKKRLGRSPLAQVEHEAPPLGLAQLLGIADAIIPEGVEMTEQQTNGAQRVRTGISRRKRDDDGR